VKLCPLLNTNPLFSLFSVSGTHHSAFHLYEFQCSHSATTLEAFVLLWLAECTLYNVLQVHPLAACVRISFVFAVEECPAVSVCYILFIHLSVSEHLGCVHLLAIVNKAAMNMSVQIPLWELTSNCLGYGGITESYGNSIFQFLRNHCTVIPTNSTAGFQFLHILVNTCYFVLFMYSFTFLETGFHYVALAGLKLKMLLPQPVSFCFVFDRSHSSGCEVESPCGFDFHFPNDLWCCPFHMLTDHLQILLWEMSTLVLCPVLLFCFLWAFEGDSLLPYFGSFKLTAQMQLLWCWFPQRC
jgi:hypothetical protein